MVRESQDGTLGDLVGRAAAGAVVGALLLLALGLLAELLRRRHRARRVLALLDLTVPMGVRTVIVSVLALASSFMGPHPAGAADSVRGWLREVGTSTTTRIVATPGAVAAHAASPAPSPSTTTPVPTAAPTGPVVLIPPITAVRPDPAPRGPPPAAVATPAASTRAPVTAARPAPAPAPAPAAAGTTYIVQRGDCLWSIAAGVLGPRATASSIDAGWRAIYAANRAAIGDDPNLILIGRTLTLPPLVAQP
jgi:nucleoid-associated protein YgaU